LTGHKGFSKLSCRTLVNFEQKEIQPTPDELGGLNYYFKIASAYMVIKASGKRCGCSPAHRFRHTLVLLGRFGLVGDQHDPFDVEPLHLLGEMVGSPTSSNEHALRFLVRCPRGVAIDLLVDRA